MLSADQLLEHLSVACCFLWQQLGLMLKLELLRLTASVSQSFTVKMSSIVSDLEGFGATMNRVAIPLLVLRLSDSLMTAYGTRTLATSASSFSRYGL